LTLQEKAARADVVVGSAPFVEPVDDIQYGGGEGPCISASASGQIIRSGSVDADPRWPGFGPGAGRLGVHSVLSLPLLADDDLIGSMNVYAHPEDAFDDRAERIGSMFAVSAAVTAQNAHMLAQTQRATANMQEVLTSRAVINQAVGMIVARTGWTAEEALRRLQNQSENEHRTVSAVATTVVEEATRRARRRLRRT
jgi:GAF domain-containing protein